MKKIMHKNIQKEIVFDRDSLYYLCIENIIFYREFILGVQNQIETDEEYILLYGDEKNIKLGKCFALIDDPLMMQIDDKKLNTSIQKDVSSHINVESKERYEILLQQISEYIESISYDYPIALRYEDNLPLASFLKAFSLSYTSEKGTVLENILNNVKALTSVFGYEIYMFLNLCDYLDKSEMITFEKEMKSMELDFFIVSNHLPKYRTDDEFIIHIDDDLCELHIDSKEKQ